MTKENTYTRRQLLDMGFTIEEDWILTQRGGWVGDAEEGTIDLIVDYEFHAEPDENGLWHIDDGLYAFNARVIDIDFWNGSGSPPFEIGEVFDTLDEVTFADCKE
jgi:hypothetical protein